MKSLKSEDNKLKFLSDENVKLRLSRLLISKAFDVKLAPKRLSDNELSKISKSEERILITNDIHFTNSFLFPKERIFSIILLKIPQNEPELLLICFSELLSSLSSLKEFEGNLIKLYKDRIEISEIPSSK